MLKVEIDKSSLTKSAMNLLTRFFLKVFNPSNSDRALPNDVCIVWEYSEPTDARGAIAEGTVRLGDNDKILILTNLDSDDNITDMSYQVVLNDTVAKTEEGLTLTPMQEMEIKISMAPKSNNWDTTHAVNNATAHMLFDDPQPTLFPKVNPETGEFNMDDLDDFFGLTSDLVVQEAEKRGGYVAAPDKFVSKYQFNVFMSTLAHAMEETILNQMEALGKTHVKLHDAKYKEALVMGNTLHLTTRDSDTWFNILPHDEQVRVAEKLIGTLFKE